MGARTRDSRTELRWGGGDGPTASGAAKALDS